MKSKILLLAGEESGVLYAGQLAEHLRSAGAEIRGYGDYGFKTADLAVIGFGPVLLKLFYFLGVARTMKRVIREWRPDVVVTVDYPGLNLKLAAYAKKRGIPAVHIVCPQVWAWRRNRIPKVAAAISELLCFFPFEPEFFRGTGLDVKFIGHPLVGMVKGEGWKVKDEGLALRSLGEGGGKKRGERLIALLPGSRIGEIRRILPRLLKAVEIVASGQTLSASSGQTLKIVIPAANAGAELEINRIVAAAKDLPQIEVRRGGARALLRSADCAAVASGTATLEAALVRCPTVLVYAVAPFWAWVARRVITGVRHLGLANIVAEKCGFEPPMPELLQEAFTPEAVAAQLEIWLSDEASHSAAVAQLDHAMGYLEAGGAPLQLAAQEIMSKC